MLRYAPSNITHGVSIDISDAYHHVELHPEIAKYFQFKVGDDFYQCCALPFGWRLSPFVFTKLMRPVISAIRNPS